MFICHLSDGSTYSENQGYWDTCPDTGITSLHLTLPFAIKKRNPDGTVVELDPSTVEIGGYQAYYFANKARNTVLVLQAGVANAGSYTPFYDGQVMAGIDYEHDFVCYVDMDKRGNVTFKRYSVAGFMEKYQVKQEVIRKGV
jgi:hypothetical protein